MKTLLILSLPIFYLANPSLANPGGGIISTFSKTTQDGTIVEAGKFSVSPDYSTGSLTRHVRSGTRNYSESLTSTFSVSLKTSTLQRTDEDPAIPGGEAYFKGTADIIWNEKFFLDGQQQVERTETFTHEILIVLDEENGQKGALLWGGFFVPDHEIFRENLANDNRVFVISEFDINTTYCLPSIGDLNQDGRVDAADAGLLMSNWGNSGIGDLNNDGVVNMADSSILTANWDR